MALKSSKTRPLVMIFEGAIFFGWRFCGSAASYGLFSYGCVISVCCLN